MHRRRRHILLPDMGHILSLNVVCGHDVPPRETQLVFLQYTYAARPTPATPAGLAPLILSRPGRI